MMKTVFPALAFLLVACTGFQHLHAQSLIPYRMTTGWGYCDSNMKLRIPGPFTYAEPFVDGRARVRVVDTLPYSYCLIDTAGQLVVPPRNHWDGTNGSPFNRLNAVDSSGKAGQIDWNGSVRIPFEYDAPFPATANFCVRADEIRGRLSDLPGFRRFDGSKTLYLIASKDGKFGVADSSNEVIVPFEFDELRPLTSGGGYTDSLLGWGGHLVDSCGAFLPNGKTSFPARYDAVYPGGAGSSVAAAKKNGRVGLIDSTGAIVLPFLYDSINVIGSIGAQLYNDDRWSWWDHSGPILTGRFECPLVPEESYLSTTICRDSFPGSGGSVRTSKSMLLDRKGKALYRQ